MIESLRRLCDRYDVTLDEQFFEYSCEFARLLYEWNKTHSLTTFKTSTELAQNIFNAVYPIKFLPDFNSCLDVGSGAGFPALPLAFAKPKTRFVLTEPKGKKYAFLEFVKITLSLQNVEVLKERVENVVEKFDLITSRAVGSKDILMKLTVNAMDKNTKMLLFKGEKEIAKEENSDNSAEIFQMPFGNYILL